MEYKAENNLMKVTDMTVRRICKNRYIDSSNGISEALNASFTQQTHNTVEKRARKEEDCLCKLRLSDEADGMSWRF